MLYQSFLASGLFYCAHWQTYVTGTMRFGKVDVTEGQFCVMAFMIITALTGDVFWGSQFLGVPLYLVPTVVGTVCGGVSLVGMLETISQGGAGKNGSTVAVRAITLLANMIRKLMVSV